jgi:hypothetical protein
VSGEKWSIECDYMESCNCDFGRACNFSGFPNYGRCETLVGFHIRSGNYGNVSLDGLDFIYAASWPREIHQGNRTMRVYIAERAFAEQRQADQCAGRDDQSGSSLPPTPQLSQQLVTPRCF